MDTSDFSVSALRNEKAIITFLAALPAWAVQCAIFDSQLLCVVGVERAKNTPTFGRSCSQPASMDSCSLVIQTAQITRMQAVPVQRQYERRQFEQWLSSAGSSRNHFHSELLSVPADWRELENEQCLQ